jgi:hypothetical protein
MRYANLAVRGRRMDEILDEQVQTAVMLEPDLITVYAGMNNLLLLRNDVDAMMARYAEGLKTLQQTGAVVVTFTAADLGTVPLFRRLRGRAAVYNELLRGIADDLGLQTGRLLALHRVSRLATVGWRSHPPVAAGPRTLRRQSS